MGCASSAAVPKASNTLLEFFHDQWEVHGYLGGGNFGEVRVARSKQDSREEAVKIVSTRRETKRNEVAVWKALGHHPNIVSFIGEFQDDSAHYMVMERCGCDLRNFILDRMHTPECYEEGWACMFKQMLSALQHLHSKHIVHRDVKPEHFLYERQDLSNLKLCDFGLAAFVPRSGKLFGTFGTPAFMSPEMVADGPHNTMTDLWSLGILCYLAVCGRHPYEPMHRNPGAMKRAIVQGLPELSFQGPRTIPADARDFVSALLTRNMSNRISASDALHHPFLTTVDTQVDLLNIGDAQLEDLKAFSMRKRSMTPVPEETCSDCGSRSSTSVGDEASASFVSEAISTFSSINTRFTL